jgi:hypothetical protein
MRNIMLRAVVLAVVLALVAGCNSFGTQETEFTPHGTTFTLNPNIAVSRGDGNFCSYNPNGLFQLSLYARSLSGVVEGDTLVAGLFLVSKSDSVQHMLLVKPWAINVGTTDTVIALGCYCCNSGLHAPESVDTYEIGPVTDNAKLKQIIDIVRDKDVTSDVITVQTAVWQVTDNGELTQDMIDQLNALPPDTSHLAR